MTSLAEDAAHWFLRIQDNPADEAERSRFEAWLTSHPAHAAAYAGIAEVWAQMDTTSGVATLAQAVRQQAQRRKRRLVGGGALGLLLATGTGGLSYRAWHNQALWQLSQQTLPRQTLHLALPDGSTGRLGAASRLELRYTRAERLARLLGGEVSFDVARDEERPFIVDSGPARVIVLGTRFVVMRLTDRVRVSVVRGRVLLEGAPRRLLPWRRPSLVLEAGDVAEVLDENAVRQAPVRVARDAADAFAFERGLLVFRNATAAEVSETVSRYRTAPVRVKPLNLDTPRINAVVQLAGIEDFLHTLPLAAPVIVDK